VTVSGLPAAAQWTYDQHNRQKGPIQKGRMEMKKLLSLLLTAAMVLTLFTGCQQLNSNGTGDSGGGQGDVASGDGDPIYVAMHIPLTGDAAQYGGYISNGFMVAIDECNANGGINGRKIVVDIFDDKSDSAEASTIATKIAENDKYIAVVGSYTSTCSLAVAPIYSEYQIVNFCPTAGSMDLPEYPYTFTMAMGEKYEFDLFAKLAASLAGKDGRVGYIHQTNDNGIASVQVVSESIPKYGAEVTFTDSYNEGEVRDFTAIVTKLKDADLDLICMNATYAEQASFLVQLRSVGVETPVMFASPANCKEFIEAAGEYAEGCYTVATFSYLDTSEGVQHFVQGFEEKTGNAMPTSFAQQPYEQGCMLVKALQEGADDRASLYDTLKSWTDWNGPTITATFRENGSLERSSLTLLQVMDNAWAFADHA
jgi:branched-chain amino acid transport system substrate-binding protein